MEPGQAPVRHAHALLENVLSSSLVITRCLAHNHYIGSSTVHAEFRSTLASVNYEFWDLLGFIHDSEPLILGSISGFQQSGYDWDASFVSQKAQFNQFGSRLTDKESAELESPEDSVIALKELHYSLSTFKDCLRRIYTIAEETSNSFRTQPFRLTVNDIMRKASLPEIDGHRASNIASLGTDPILASLVSESGIAWVKQTVGNEPVSVTKLCEVQFDVLKNLDVFFADSILEKMGPVHSLHESIQKEIERAGSQRFCVTFCGTVKAGKSQFLNALTGQQLLPSDELPLTTWPCRFIHAPKAKIPVLSINTKYFDDPLKELRRRKIAATMESYRPPSSSNHFASLADDDDDNDYSNFDESYANSTLTSGQDDLNGALYHDWKDLHDYTKKNLKVFENESFRLPNAAQGDEEVVQLLGMVNDIVRLCRIFKIDVPEAEPDTWPRLTVEFESLRDKTIEGTFEFIDLPSIGEAHSDFHSFEGLVRIAAKEADTVVPIISFKDAAKGVWRKQLPQIVQTGLKRPPDFVLCTHMDQVQTKSRVTQQVNSVGKEFWPTITDFESRVLRCSTRLGIGAQLLITQSQNKKPRFENIWKENTIIFDCVKNILGICDAEQKFEEMDHKEWIEALHQQLENSHLQDVISQLTAGIMNRTQGLALQLEGRKLMLMIKRIASGQKQTLAEISRSRNEFEHAFLQAPQRVFRDFCGICEGESKKLRSLVEVKLERAFAILELNGLKSAVLAVENAANRVEHQAPKSKFGTVESNEIVFSTKFESDKFFYTAQDMMVQDANNNLKREFVGFVRKLADRSRLQLFEIVVQKLKSDTKEKEAPPYFRGRQGSLFKQKGSPTSPLFKQSLFK